MKHTAHMLHGSDQLEFGKTATDILCRLLAQQKITMAEFVALQLALRGIDFWVTPPADAPRQPRYRR